MIKAKELRLKTKTEIEKMIKDEKIRLADLIFKFSASQIKNTSEFSKIRKNIAVLLTVLNEINSK